MILQDEFRYTPQTESIQHDDHHSPHPVACSFSLSRESRVRRVPTRSACEEPGRKPPDPRRLRIREFDAIRRRPDTLTRITRPPYGLPVRGRGTRDCRLPVHSACSGHSLIRVRDARLAADWFPFVPIQGRAGSVRAERTEVVSQQPRSDSCGYVEPRSLRWRGTPDFESGSRRFDSGRGDMPTWCNPASIRSCHGRDPGSNPGVGVDAWINHVGIPIEVGSPLVRSAGSFPRCWAQQGLQPT